jgi:parallel beta-helix repeat protein
MSKSWLPRLRSVRKSRPSTARRAAALRRVPSVEAMETRQLLSNVFTVTNTGDNGNNSAPVPGSLRAAVVAANNLPAGTYSTIKFNIGGSGLHTISLQASLPSIINPVNIDGLSQPGSSATTPLIDVDGTSAGPSGAVGLSVNPSASGFYNGTYYTYTQVSGLQITNFSEGGVVVYASYVKLTDDFVGVLELKNNFIDNGNGNFGVIFYGGSHDTLSGSVVAGNHNVGVTISQSSYDVLTGDFIGTDVTGEDSLDLDGNSLGNQGDGVDIYGASTHNTVTKSVIGNNYGQGVYLSDTGTEYNTLSLDFIGTDQTGSYALPNQVHGVLVTNNASDNTIGGSTSSFNDLISGNAYDGVALSNGADFNKIEGDYIGTNAAGTAAIPNGASGVFFSDANDNTVGGTSAALSNVISGDTGYGVYIGGSTKDVIEGNFIGLNANGNGAVPNGQTGVWIDTGSTYNTIGGTKTGALNVISGNSQWGVMITGTGTAYNTVEGNYVGTDYTGSVAIGNGYNGLDITSGATYNTVGGKTAAARNVISGNVNNGVDIAFSGTSHNVVEGNYIGLNAAGTAALSNRVNGVVIEGGATENTIGGTTAGERNVISANSSDGVYITGSGTTVNSVEGNYIGLNAAGTAALDNTEGVVITNGASGNTIGGSSTSFGNVISGNSIGVEISQSGSDNNLVDNNLIGTNPADNASMGNGTDVETDQGADNNIFQNNVIAGATMGVFIPDASTTGNQFSFNDIGTDRTGTLNLGNYNGVVIDYAQGNTIANNVIENSTYAGIYIYQSPNAINTIYGNTFANNAGGNIVQQ